MWIAFSALSFLFVSAFLALVASGLYANSAHAERRAHRAIEAECLRLGCDKAQAFSNGRSSFGVWFWKDGRKFRGKASCWVGLWSAQVTWLDNDPSGLSPR